jgi:uncharacterized protein (DUF2236 family)
LLTFSFLVIEGLRKLGANISSEAAQAYFETWCAVGRLLGVHPEMLPESWDSGAKLRTLIEARQFAPSEEGREMTRALIEMMQRNSPPLLEGIPVGLMRLFMESKIADYLGIPDSSLQQDLAGIIVGLAKLIDFDLKESHWRAMIFRHHILSIVEGMINAEGGNERDFFRLPTDLHQRWRGASPATEESIWGHLAHWVVSRI